MSDLTPVGDFCKSDESFGDLYVRHADAVFGCAMAILRDSFEAQDVVQEVFIQAWNQSDRYQPSRGSVGTWLRMVARSRAIDRLRVLRRTGTTAADSVEEPVSESDADNSLNNVLSVERMRSVQDALAQLPVQQQRLLELSFDAGLSHSNIAAVLRQPLGTVKTHIRQALIELRDRTHKGLSKPRTEVSADQATPALPFTIIGEESFRTLPPSGSKRLDTINTELRGLRVLLVDDDAEALKLTSAVIRRFGAIPEARGSAVSALDQTALFESDVMIVDLMMPEQDGYSFLGAARALAKRQELALPPAVAFTASASEEERSRVRLAGFESYLTKPVHPLALLSTIASLIPHR